MVERTPLAERFWSKVNKNGPIPKHRPDLGPCWLWTGYISRDGYGKIAYGKRGDAIHAHNIGYLLLRGPIDDGLEFDHLCKVRHCVNPWHGERTTHTTNVMRGEGFSVVNAAKTHCAQGHPFDEENTIRRTSGGRGCRLCQREAGRRYKQRRKEKRCP
jgi:hypothetical protein